MNILTSIWDFIWFMFWLYVVIAFLGVLFSVFADLFRDKDLSGWLKAVWMVFLVFLPVLSTLVYLVARGNGMAVRHQKQAEIRQGAQAAYFRSLAGTSVSDEIRTARELLDAGSITSEEYELIKTRALGN